MVAELPCVTLTVVLVEKAEQPPEAGMSYKTVYVPEVLLFACTLPVEAFIDRPAGAAVKTPPAVPVLVAFCGFASEVQKGEVGYAIVALNTCVIVTTVVVVYVAQPLAAATV
jgi:hypothetical protein